MLTLFNDINAALCNALGISSYLQGVVIMVCINVIAVLGMSVLTGFTRLFSFGNAGFMSIGAYTAAILTVQFKVNFLLAIILGALFAGLVPEPIVSRMPRTIAPTIAPGTLPRPPMTEAINALRPTLPICGKTLYFMPYSTPPTPASAPASRKTSAMLWSTFTPSTFAEYALHASFVDEINKDDQNNCGDRKADEVEDADVSAAHVYRGHGKSESIGSVLA